VTGKAEAVNMRARGDRPPPTTESHPIPATLFRILPIEGDGASSPSMIDASFSSSCQCASTSASSSSRRHRSTVSLAAISKAMAPLR
jgi:hypothetical protein